MSEPIVTHADLPELERIRQSARGHVAATRRLLDRLIAAAKADAPPLPEGLALVESDDGSHRALWHKGGILYTHDDYSSGGWYTEHFRSVTPLRPTVSEADVERAAKVTWDGAKTWQDHVRAIFAAAGIEVSS